MNRTDKKQLRQDIIGFYNLLAHTLYKKYCYKGYTANEIRHEILKIFIDHIMLKTTKALYTNIKCKKKARKARRTKDKVTKQKKLELVDVDGYIDFDHNA